METPHPSDQTLNSYRLGMLDDGSAEAVTRHLDTCPECRRRAASMSSASFLGWVAGGQKGAAQPQPEATLTEEGKTASVPPAAGTLPPGLVDHRDYEIQKELGRGGMGVVYLAHNTLMGRDEVLKVMGRQIIERPGALDRFVREIRAVAKLRHPNIVSAYSAFRLDESIVFAMEYVEGLDLSKMVKAKGPLSVVHASNFVAQAALGLQHAHDEGLVHRDIKPGNLMLTRRGDRATIKLLDFGLAKATREENVDGDLTAQGQVLGTPDFIAPEQILDAKTADIRADIYSLGATLYYLLTGRPPFMANSLYEICQAHISRTAEPLNFVRPEVPAELAALVAKMMAKGPARRPQTPGEVAEALTPFFKKAKAAYATPMADVSRAGPVFEQTQPDLDAGNLPVTAGKAAETSVVESRWEKLIDVRGEEPAGDAALAGDPGRRPSQKTRPIIAATSLLGLVALGVIILLAISDKKGNELPSIVKTEAEVPRTDVPIHKDVQISSSKSDDTVGSRIPESSPPSPDPTPGPGPSIAPAVAVAPSQPVSPSDGKPPVSFTGDISSKTVDDSVLSATRSVYTDDFNDLGSRWPKGNGYGYSDGVYFIGPVKGRFYWQSPRRIRTDSTLEVVGRLKSEQPLTHEAWAVAFVRPMETSHRGFAVKLNGKGELFLMSNSSPDAKASHKIDPTIGPIVHPAIKPGDQFNRLLLAMKGRSLEIYVNSVRVCEPVMYDFDLTPSQFLLAAFDGRGNSRAEFDKVEIREFSDGKPRLTPTVYSSIRPATRPVYFDDFKDPHSGWSKGDHWGYANGFYFANPRNNLAFFKSPIRFQTDSTLEVVGRLKSEGTSSRAAWAVVLNREIGTVRRGFMVKLDVKGQLFLTPNPLKDAKEFREIDPTIGPIVNAAIKPGDQNNRLLLVIRKRSLEIFVNSVRVCEPVPYDFDLVPSPFQVGVVDGADEFRVEFDSVMIREFIRP